jgi:hypothetical protein
MKHFWKMTAGAVLAGTALGYCTYQEIYATESTPSNLEERVQSPLPSSKPKPQGYTYPNHVPSEKERLEETRQRIIEYAEEVKRNQEMSSSGNPAAHLYDLPFQNFYGNKEDDENRERPWYDLPPEERKPEKIAKGFNGALDAKDYRVAASYIDDFEAFSLPGEEEEDKKAITYVVVSGYNDFLNEIIQDCQKYGYDYDSIFRKVIWMDFFLIDHQGVLPMFDPVIRDQLELVDFIQKGEQAIQAVSGCHNSNE